MSDDKVYHENGKVKILLRGGNGIAFSRTPDEADALACDIFAALQDLHVCRNEMTPTAGQPKGKCDMEKERNELGSKDLLASDVLDEMDRIMHDVPGGGYIGDYAEQGRDIWPERWRTLKTWLAHGIIERTKEANKQVENRL
jgi:hypothetical protein